MLEPWQQEMIDDARRRYQEKGNLTEAEVEELISFEFVAAPATIADQIRRYVLKLKVGNPAKAEQLRTEADPHLQKGVHTEQEVHDLCIVLIQYFNGFVLTPQPSAEMQAEMDQKFELPLKTLTVKADKAYQVWHHGHSQVVQWKAWRQGRPTILGYGMTEQEAVDDLRYRIQPDHDGTLDGLDTPKGPVIGGNMLNPDYVLQHNKGRFQKPA